MFKMRCDVPNAYILDKITYKEHKDTYILYIVISRM